MLRSGILGMRGSIGIWSYDYGHAWHEFISLRSHTTSISYVKNVTSTPMLKVSLVGVGTVLCFENDAWSMVKWLRHSTNEVRPPHSSRPPPTVFFQPREYCPRRWRGGKRGRPYAASEGSSGHSGGCCRQESETPLPSRCVSDDEERY